jgi:hypothetical protein
MAKRNKSLSLERRLINNVVLGCHITTPRVEEMELSTSYSGNYKDTESDASSYLFEIESLTSKALATRTRSHLIRQPQSPRLFSTSFVY